MPNVILLGDINTDINVNMPIYPTCGGEGVATNVAYHLGGTVVTSAISLAQMGVSTGILGCIGNDALGNNILSTLKKTGVDISQIQIDNTLNTGLIYIVVTPDGERTMFSARGANTLTKPHPAWDSYFSKASWYHLSGYALLAHPQHEAALYALEHAQRHGCSISLDPNPEPALRHPKLIKALFPKIDFFLPNEEELMALTNCNTLKESIAYLLKAHLKTAIVKRGGQGCVIANHNTYLEIPAFEIDAKNTTGAGDSFNSGFIWGQHLGLSWAASGILGNALGAIASTRTGTGLGILKNTHIAHLIQQNKTKPQWKPWQAELDTILGILGKNFTAH